MRKKKSGAFLAGETAHREGRPATAVPYSLDDRPMFHDWMIGWWLRHYQTEPGGSLYQANSNPNDKEKLLHLTSLLSLAVYAFCSADNCLADEESESIKSQALAALKAWRK